MQIHIVRGIIGYHERMNLFRRNGCTACGEDSPVKQAGICPTIEFQDVYLQAMRTALTLMEREYGRMMLKEVDEENAVRCND